MAIFTVIGFCDYIGYCDYLPLPRGGSQYQIIAVLQNIDSEGLDHSVGVIVILVCRLHDLSVLLKVRLPPRSNRRSQRRKSQQRPFDDFEDDRVCRVNFRAEFGGLHKQRSVS